MLHCPVQWEINKLGAPSSLPFVEIVRFCCSNTMQFRNYFYKGTCGVDALKPIPCRKRVVSYCWNAATAKAECMPKLGKEGSKRKVWKKKSGVTETRLFTGLERERCDTKQQRRENRTPKYHNLFPFQIKNRISLESFKRCMCLGEKSVSDIWPYHTVRPFLIIRANVNVLYYCESTKGNKKKQTLWNDIKIWF